MTNNDIAAAFPTMTLLAASGWEERDQAPAMRATFTFANGKGSHGCRVMFAGTHKGRPVVSAAWFGGGSGFNKASFNVYDVDGVCICHGNSLDLAAAIKTARFYAGGHDGTGTVDLCDYQAIALAGIDRHQGVELTLQKGADVFVWTGAEAYFVSPDGGIGLLDGEDYDALMALVEASN